MKTRQRDLGVAGIILGGLALAACTAQATLAPPAPTQIVPTSLPTAVGPEAQPGTWAVSFSYEFPTGFWLEGDHRYGFYMDCPVLQQFDVPSEYRDFTVTQETIAFESPVYLRLGGLSTGALAPINLEAIHPDQATVAVVTLIGVTEEQARQAVQAGECDMVIGWDAVNAQTLVAAEPFRP
ncbi:MAG: hypothetical protein ACRDHG_02565 [Anaerolineales bacterium]